MEKKTKAIGLLSGGLDSTLAAKLILEQGIEVEAINYVTVFCTCTSRGSSCLASQKAAEQLNIPLKVIDVSEEYLEVVKKPKYGYGSGMNPCLDCRIFFFKKAKQYMEEAGAKFIFTGEVVGERPMSQRKDAMHIIERDSGLRGFIVRPLSAKLFPPTVVEEKGIVDRNKFLAISGRSRKPQISLAKEFGIKDYPCASGGCLLTDPGFSRRMKDLLNHKPDFNLNDVNLLKYGRHFRLSPEIKLVVGRNERENKRIETFKKEGDVIFYAEEPIGPIAILRGASNGQFLIEAASITARYALSKEESTDVKIKHSKCPEGDYEYILAKPFEDSKLGRLRI